MEGRLSVAVEPSVELADRRAEVTRDAIRRAVVDLLETEHPAAISVAAVATRAGVSARTIYRYFPNKQAMLDDVAAIQLRRVEAMSEPDGLYRNPERWLPALWQTFADDIATVKAQHRSPAGDDLRDRRLGVNRVRLASRLERAHPDLAHDEMDRLVDAIIAVTSSTMFLELCDRMGWGLDEAVGMSLWMVESLRKNLEGVST